MGNCGSSLRRRNREESSQGETELPNRPHTGGTQRRPRGNQGSKNLISTTPLNAPGQQTVGQQSNPREVAGADFNQYVTVDNIRIEQHSRTDREHAAGHDFMVTFDVTNTTTDYLRFTSTPPLEWREREYKNLMEWGVPIVKNSDGDMAIEKPDGRTFRDWKMAWNSTTLPPGQRQQIRIMDGPRVTNINQGKDGNPRTVHRTLDFDIGVPGNGPRVRAHQSIRVVNGVKEEELFQPQ